MAVFEYGGEGGPGTLKLLAGATLPTVGNMQPPAATPPVEIPAPPWTGGHPDAAVWEDYTSTAYLEKIRRQTPAIRTSITYDGGGHVVQLRRGNLRWRYTYDTQDRVIEMRHGPTVTSYVYDADDQVVSITERTKPPRPPSSPKTAARPVRKRTGRES